MIIHSHSLWWLLRAVSAQKEGQKLADYFITVSPPGSLFCFETHLRVLVLCEKPREQRLRRRSGLHSEFNWFRAYSGGEPGLLQISWLGLSGVPAKCCFGGEKTVNWRAQWRLSLHHTTPLVWGDMSRWARGIRSGSQSVQASVNSRSGWCHPSTFRVAQITNNCWRRQKPAGPSLLFFFSTSAPFRPGATGHLDSSGLKWLMFLKTAKLGSTESVSVAELEFRKREVVACRKSFVSTPGAVVAVS